MPADDKTLTIKWYDMPQESRTKIWNTYGLTGMSERCVVWMLDNYGAIRLPVDYWANTSFLFPNKEKYTEFYLTWM